MSPGPHRLPGTCKPIFVPGSRGPRERRQLAVVPLNGSAKRKSALRPDSPYLFIDLRRSESQVNDNNVALNIPYSMSIHTAVRSALEAAERCGITPDRLILEITAGEVIDDHAAFGRAVNEFRRFGLQLAIDDFGAGYAGLAMLADFQPTLYFEINHRNLFKCQSRRWAGACVAIISHGSGVRIGLEILKESICKAHS